MCGQPRFRYKHSLHLVWDTTCWQSLALALAKPDQGPIGLILVPSRELCQQIRQAPQIKVACVFGGKGGDYQYKSMLGKFDIMIACPGRLLDALSRGSRRFGFGKWSADRQTIPISSTLCWVSEHAMRRNTKSPVADDLLSGTNRTSAIMDNVLSQMRPPDYRQLLLFSATHQESIVKAAKTHCVSPFFQITVALQ